jgi:micrococcal nuclease
MLATHGIVQRHGATSLMSAATVETRGRSIIRRSRPRTAGIIAIGLLLLLMLRFADRKPAIAPLPPAGQPLRVVRAVDGDTLLLESGHRIRLIGVDTPETSHPEHAAEPCGEEASVFTHQLVDGRLVTLEFDHERHDDYGRILAYVSIDGRLLNEAIIEAGFSRAETRFPYRGDRKQLFENAEARAKAKQVGLWTLPAPQKMPAI